MLRFLPIFFVALNAASFGTLYAEQLQLRQLMAFQPAKNYTPLSISERAAAYDPADDRTQPSFAVGDAWGNLYVCFPGMSEIRSFDAHGDLRWSKDLGEDLKTGGGGMVNWRIFCEGPDILVVAQNGRSELFGKGFDLSPDGNVRELRIPSRKPDYFFDLVDGNLVGKDGTAIVRVADRARPSGRRAFWAYQPVWDPAAHALRFSAGEGHFDLPEVIDGLKVIGIEAIGADHQGNAFILVTLSDPSKIAFHRAGGGAVKGVRSLIYCLDARAKLLGRTFLRDHAGLRPLLAFNPTGKIFHLRYPHEGPPVVDVVELVD